MVFKRSQVDKELQRMEELTRRGDEPMETQEKHMEQAAALRTVYLPRAHPHHSYHRRSRPFPGPRWLGGALATDRRVITSRGKGAAGWATGIGVGEQCPALAS